MSAIVLDLLLLQVNLSSHSQARGRVRDVDNGFSGSGSMLGEAERATGIEREE